MMFNSLQPYITHDEPFGPIDSGDFAMEDIRAQELLFEQHNRIYKNLRNRPSIIIGRRGAGKTSYLRSVYFDKQYTFFTELRTARVLGQMTRVIQAMTSEAVFSETVSELWEKVLWAGVFSEIRRHNVLNHDEQMIVDSYLAGLALDDDGDADAVMQKIAALYDEVIKDKPAEAMTEYLRQFDSATFEQARSAVAKRLEASQKNFVILLDSLDDFQMDLDSVARSLQGLLKLVGSMNKPRDSVDIRFCLPTELYHRFLRLSSNSNKDFRRALRLQWTAGELILIGAQRLKYFLNLYYPNIAREISHLDETKRDDAGKILQTVLPPRIRNGAGFQEDTISYILRHTQLLPRHFLIFMNSIFRGMNGNPSFPVSEERIIHGIRQVEEFIVTEIFVAFKTIYPNAEAVCKACLPQLGHQFTMGDLHRVFNRHGKAAFGLDDLVEFQRMLLEIGAIGSVIPGGKESDVYIKGRFEYTVAHELVLSQESDLCIHPLFSGIFNNGRKERPVYPYGSDINDEDYREQG